MRIRRGRLLGALRPRARWDASAPVSDVADATRRYLMFVLLPAWFAPGVADWWMHRRTRIETTSGSRESLIHLLMMAEIGVPILAALLLEINPLVLAVMAGAVVVHEATAWWDVRVAVDSDRAVEAAEQHLHSFLEVIPFMAFAGIACLHWPALRALLRGEVRAAARPGAWRLRRKQPPIPARYTGSVLAAITAFIALPYGEELLRCVRSTPAGSRGRRAVSALHPVPA